VVIEHNLDIIKTAEWMVDTDAGGDLVDNGHWERRAAPEESFSVRRTPVSTRRGRCSARHQ
jgi:excinuclease UvrABC ATPase subunit